MPTIRSEFFIDQFERVLQKLAHNIPKFRTVRSDDITLTFYYDDEGKPRRITVEHHKRTGKTDRWGNEERTYWGFSVEPKAYLVSNHVSKITFGSEEDKERIEKWLEKIMSSETPIPRFSLSKHTSR